MRYKRHLFPASILVVVALAFVLAPDVLAQNNFGLSTATKGTGIPSGTQISSIIANILKIALQFVGTLFLLLMVYAGFLWMTARGEETKVKTAKQLISGAIIGVIIIASAYAITNLVLFAVTTASDETTQETSTEGAAVACSKTPCEADDVTDGTCGAGQVQCECPRADGGSDITFIDAAASCP
jgi:lysylphosphatidylglycerol synthetase-like protein (DUF2156 family)